MHALTRSVSATIGRCELTHLQRREIDVSIARDQHARYEACLTELGYELIKLSPQTDYPDSVFVEDTAVILPELAIITRPGAATRRGETKSIAAALQPFRVLFHIEEPGIIDGGDVLVAGKTIFIGVTSRTNSEAISQIKSIVSSSGYTVVPVEVDGCLHLKSAATLIADNLILVNNRWVDPAQLLGFDTINVDETEPNGANALFAAGNVICQPNYPRTIARIEAAGIPVLQVDASELTKAEGALTCCSLLID